MTPDRHALLTELFGEALALSATEREALLQRVRTDEPALASELAALLDADGRDAPGLDTGALAATTAAASPGALASADTVSHPDEGTRRPSAQPRRIAIPGFRLLEALGEGGMGTVWAGEQDAPRRPVAIKILHAHARGALARFWAEAEIMARLDHPGIAKVLEAGEAEGHPYFVMERVDGELLDAFARTAPLAARLSLFVGLCEAVHHAHVKGVFHRDLKPSNIMVRPDGRVVVLDFGIARAEAMGTDTRAGELIGTPVYMSPEQARLRPDAVDARSDVYTLGVILYELVSGELPYAVRGKSLLDVARAICHDAPRPLGKLQRAWRGDLEAICDRALAKEPVHRYPSAAALGDDVRRYLEGATVSARVPGALEQVRRFARRRPGIAAAIAGALLASAVFATVVTALYLEARAARAAAETERARVSAAHRGLEERTNQLVLDQAHAAIAQDPTAAIAALRTLTAPGVDAAKAWAIADEAFGRGVASETRTGHGDELRWIEALPSGFVTGGYDGLALRWERGAAAVLARLPARIHVVRPAADGRTFAIGADGGGLMLVDADGGERRIAGLTGEVEHVAWSPDGAWLAAGDEAGRVVLVPRATGEPRVLVGSGAALDALAWSADSARLAVATAATVRVWDLAAATEASAPIAHEAVVVGLAGDALTAVLEDGAVLRWDVDGAALRPRGAFATGAPCKAAAIAADGAQLVIGAPTGAVLRVAGDAREALSPHTRQVRAVAISPDGRRVATSSDDTTVQVWDLVTGRHHTLRGHAQRVRTLAFSPDGATLLSGDSAGSARRWDLDAIPPTVLDHPSGVAQLAIGPDGATMVTADASHTLWRWDLATGGRRRLGAHEHPVVALAHSAARAASADRDGAVRWWTAATVAQPRVPGAAARTMVAQQRVPGAAALALAADGARTAVATQRGPIALFTGDGVPAGALSGHAGGTDAIAFSPDGALLASGGQDRVVRVWSLAAPAAPPRELGPLPDDTRHVAFARGGALLLAAGDDGAVRAWTVAPTGVTAGAPRVLATRHGGVLALATDGGDRAVVVGRDRVRVELALAAGTARELPGLAAFSEGELLRQVPLPIAAGRAVWLAQDGTALHVLPETSRTFAALQAALAPR